MAPLRCSNLLVRPQRWGGTSYSASICRLRCGNLQTRSRHSRPAREAPQLSMPQQPSHLHRRQDAEHNGTILEADLLDHEQTGPEDPHYPQVKVRFLRPAIFALSVSSAIFISLAYLEAKKELKPKSIRDYVPKFQIQRRTPPTPTEVATQLLNELDPMSKLSWGIIGSNSAVHLTKYLIPQSWALLWHMPAANVNYTLFTSTFVHGGPMHLGINMYAAYNFLPVVGYSKLFRGDTNHVLSFYLAAGLLSGYAQHVASAVINHHRSMPSKFIPSGGASGALFAVLGVFCMQYPNHGIGIMFVPYYLDAQYVLPAIMLFDLVGMVRGYSFVNLGHAAHLGGASFGLAYSYFDGYSNLWRPLVNFWKRRL